MLRTTLGSAVWVCGIALAGVAGVLLSGCTAAQADPLEVTYYYLPG